MDSEKVRVDSKDDVQIDYNATLESLTTDVLRSESEFIGSEPLTIKTTNAQEIYNNYQMYPKVLVFDLRDSSRYQYCHLK